MKNQSLAVIHFVRPVTVGIMAFLAAATRQASADPAPILFQDEFNGENPGWPGWTAVQPAGGNYLDGPMLWEYNHFSQTFSEDSNIYTDSAAVSSTRMAVMLINDTVAPTNLTYTARLTAADDDSFGLIWGYQDERNFYRVEFARQAGRVGWPWQGWHVDRMSNNVYSELFGANTAINVPFVNTQYRPFDVTISVANGLLSLSVADDPAGVSNYIDLVASQPLPTAPSGKVGMFSWGQNGNGGFRIGNLALSPTPLTGAPNTLSASWTPVVTPRSNGTTNLNSGITPDWSLGINASGNRGWLIEHSDAFQSTDNAASGTTNYAAPTLLAGNNTWSNYLYYARFQTGDDDGFGMVFRYLNETNFYRIAFRAQNSQSGIKQGWSIQKCANLVFDQIAAGNNFIPTLNIPIDVYLEILTNRLLVLIVSNPAGASPQRFTLGPFNITGPTVDQGKIGILSWAQSAASGTQVDFARVYELVGEALFVASAFGTPDPPAGVNSFPVGSSVTSTVENVVVTLPNKIRQANSGWVGTGSVPATGSTNQAVFALDTLSSITWLWRTEYYLATNANSGGSVTSTLGPWVPAGSNVTVTASASPGYVFTRWSGDSISTIPVLTIPMVRPLTLTANFAVDSDGDGLPDSWEVQYFGDLSQTATGDPDSDGKNNLQEYQLGTNPTFAENLVFADGLSSRWINEVRDRALPGWFAVTNFGGGFRGVWEASNQNRGANSAGPDDAPFINVTNYATNASFQGPLIVVRSNVWNTDWATTFSLSAEYSVGDNDGLCLYFRYLNASNWYRVTVCGDDTAAPTRPLQYVSIQKRTNGWFSVVTPASESGFLVYNDELDSLGFKRLRVTVNGTNDTFEVRVIGWNALLSTPDWDPNFERVLMFTSVEVPTGRIAVGPWGMDGGKGGWNATNGNPVGAGLFMDNIILQVSGTNAFAEDWETATLHTDLPAGWQNPYAGGPIGGLVGDWHMSAHGTIANFNFAYGSPQTGTAESPKADGEGPILLAPPLTNANFVLELGIHPCDDGGMGFIYDFKDTNNFARVLFSSQVPLAGQLAQGVNISRKSGGVWSNIVAGDPSFIYAPGRPFDVRFANNNGTYTMTASPTDDPSTVYRWNWTDQSAQQTNRVGLAIWDMSDAHYTYFRATALPAVAPIVPFKISQIGVSGGNVILDVSKPAGASYHVLRATSVVGPYLTNAANQSGAQYIEPAPVGSPYFYRLQLLP